MDLSKLHVVIADDNGDKIREIREALKNNGIRDIEAVRNQQQLWDRIYSDGSDLRKPDLIVTDMQYPLTVNSVVDKEAGFKLIERMKKEQIDIPVIICSEANYVNYKEVLGTVWYREEKDIYFPFKEVLERLE